MFTPDRPPDELKGWPTVPPAFVAEVVDGPADFFHVMSKVPLYLAFGVDLIWVVRPQLKDVLVYRVADHPAPIDRVTWPDSRAERRTHHKGNDILDGGDVLPGFRCTAADLFA